MSPMVSLFAQRSDIMDDRERISVQFVSVRQAMAMLGLGRTKFYELIKAKEIEALKFGAKTAVLLESLREFVERHRGGPPKPGRRRRRRSPI
jgi:excisionase family DNA binding protein